MATLDQIAKKELDKQNRRDAEFGYLSGSGKSSDQPDENLATAQEEVFKEWIVTPSLDKVVETGFDYGFLDINTITTLQNTRRKSERLRVFLSRW